MDTPYKHALATVKNPFSTCDIITDGQVLDIRDTARSVHITVQVDPAMGKAHRSQLEIDIKSALAPIAQKTVKVVLTAEKTEKNAGISEVKYTIAIASGKGGVGKSTTAVNLAYAYQKLGKSVGILDADVFGPSVPLMMGQNVPYGIDKGALIPVNYQGIKAMSMGFLVPENKPVIWRGPMVMGAITKLLDEVRWGQLDILVIDMPPGTGDTQLSVGKSGRLSGAVIVSTPQDVALLDARKAIAMFEKIHIPIVGIIENMSVFVCPHCHTKTHIFGSNGAKAEAQKQGIRMLGEIPLQYHIRKIMDAGVKDDDIIQQYYTTIADNIWGEMVAKN